MLIIYILLSAALSVAAIVHIKQPPPPPLIPPTQRSIQQPYHHGHRRQRAHPPKKHVEVKPDRLVSILRSHSHYCNNIGRSDGLHKQTSVCVAMVTITDHTHGLRNAETLNIKLLFCTIILKCFLKINENEM